MRKPAVLTAKEAVDMIHDGDTLCTIAMTLISASETVLKEVESRFLEQGHPRDLTFFVSRYMNGLSPIHPLSPPSYVNAGETLSFLHINLIKMLSSN